MPNNPSHYWAVSCDPIHRQVPRRWWRAGPLLACSRNALYDYAVAPIQRMHSPNIETTLGTAAWISRQTWVSVSEIQAHWPGPSDVRDKLESSDGKTIVCVFGRPEIARIAHGCYHVWRPLSLGTVTRRRGSDVLEFRALRGIHPVQVQALDVCSPLGHSSVKGGGDASASRSLNEGSCWMSGRPNILRVAKKTVVHGCLVCFVWLTGDLSSHCIPYVDDDDEAFITRSRSRLRKLDAYSG